MCLTRRRKTEPAWAAKSRSPSCVLKGGQRAPRSGLLYRPLTVGGEVKALLGGLTGQVPLDVGVARVHVVAIRLAGRGSVTGFELVGAPLDDRHVDPLQMLSVELGQFSGVFRSGDDHAPEQAPGPAQAVVSQIPVPTPGRVPAHREAGAHRAHDLAGARECLSHLLEAHLGVPGPDAAGV